MDSDLRLTLTTVVLGSDLFDDPVDYVHWTPAIALLLLAHLLHYAVPARI